MARCHGCFHLLDYCTCARTQIIEDPETGQTTTRDQFDRWLRAETPRMEGYVHVCMPEREWRKFVTGEANFAEFVAYVESVNQSDGDE